MNEREKAFRDRLKAEPSAAGRRAIVLQELHRDLPWLDDEGGGKVFHICSLHILEYRSFDWIDVPTKEAFALKTEINRSVWSKPIIYGGWGGRQPALLLYG